MMAPGSTYDDALFTPAEVERLHSDAVDQAVQEMSDARQAIQVAEEADAARFAPGPLNEALRFLATAEQQLRREAYGPARANAVRAKNRAVEALEATQAAVQPQSN